MLHLFLISLLPVVVLGNPFQKYPYVFLLDVGNEEIGKFSTEQIRLSIPGGSLAVRYPAVGEGDTIGHVRVSGIDFGTDLKASIIQGGPGYKFAVFVFMGNPGTPYDAVVTIQTVPNMDVPPPKLEISNKESIDEADANDSSEDISDNSITKTLYSGNKKQIMQSSSNVYQYTSNDAVSEDDIKNGVESQSDEDFHDEKEDDDNDDNDDDDEGDDDYKSGENTHAKSGYSEENSDDVRVDNVNRNQYGIYEAFKPHWFGGVRFYPQAALYAQDSYGKPVSSEENRDSDELSENNYKDVNNNINEYYGPPIEYK